jgi:hypothetical protein
MDAPVSCQSRDAARDHEIGERVVMAASAEKNSLAFAQISARTFSKSHAQKKMRAFGMTTS